MISHNILKILQYSTRKNSNFHIGQNVKLRRSESQPLININVTVLHKDNRGVVIANLLSSRGAKLTHYVKDGSPISKVEGKRVFIDLKCEHAKDNLLSNLKSADVFIDTTTNGIGMEPESVLKINGTLIYTQIKDEPTPFSSMRALAYINGALFGREKTKCGQILTIEDSDKSFKRIDKINAE